MFERSDLDCRSDILTYTSAPLEEDLTLLGTVIVECYCQADAPSFDLCAILSQVYPEGQVYNIAQGYKRLDTTHLPIQIPLQTTFIKITQGNRLRLSLSASCFPAYLVNGGTGKPSKESRTIKAKLITLNVFCQGNYPAKFFTSTLDVSLLFRLFDNPTQDKNCSE